MSGSAFVAFTLLQSQGRADLTGKLHIIEFLPFLALLWSLTLAFGVIGAAIAWSYLRCAVRCSRAVLAVRNTEKKRLVCASSGCNPCGELSRIANHRLRRRRRPRRRGYSRLGVPRARL